MANINRFSPKGKTKPHKILNQIISTHELTYNKQPEKIGINMNSPEEVYKIWQNMGAPNCIVYIYGYKIDGGILVK